MRRVGRWTVVLLALVALALAAAWALKSRRTQPVPIASAPATESVALDLGVDDLVRVGRAELVRTLEVSGSIRAVETAFVKARVAAVVDRITVREGDPVRAGQVVAVLDTREFDLRLRQAEQQAAAARAQLDIAERALANNRALVAQGFISATALESSAANAAAARANLRAAGAAADLARKSRADATLRAPISGFVSQRPVQPGERVAVDARILEIVDLSRMELEASISPDDIAAVHVGAPVSLRVEGVGEPIPARVDRIAPSAQAGSRTVTAYLSIDGRPALRQGLFARGWIELERRDALVVPADALRNDQAQPYLVAVDGTRAVYRVPKLGARGQAGGVAVVEILAGASAGDRVLAGRVGLVGDGTRLRLPSAAAAGSG